MKATIFYSRSGRILSTKRVIFYLQILLALFLSFILFFLVDIISHSYSEIAKMVLTEGKINSKVIFGLIELNYLDCPGRFPSSQELLFYSVFFIGVLFIQFFFDYIRPLKIFLNFFLLIFGISLLFFLMFKSYFSYALSDYSYLYILMEMILLSTIPLLLGFATGFLNFSLINLLLNFIFIIIVWLYAYIFGLIRYIFFIYLMKDFSYVWLANSFFNFGPLLDSIYLSGFYGFYLSILSKVYRKKIELWRWSF